MKIEKGKLYYDTKENRLLQSIGNGFREDWTDKIAVYCPTKDDWDYVNKKMNWDWSYSSDHTIRLLDDAIYRLCDVQEAEQKGYHVITIHEFKEFYPPQIDQDEYSWVNNGLQDVPVKKTFNPKPYYDNSKGSLYKVATERGWSSYIFDVVKRLERGGKKDPLRQEIEKSIDVLKIWLNEID